MRTCLLTFSGLAAALLLTGCTATENARTDIGAGTTLATISGEAGLPLESPEPSALTIARRDWDPIEFRVPLDTTAHQPGYRWEDLPPSYVASARDRGEYPTASTVLLTGEGSEGAALHLLASPVVAGAEVATGIVGLFITPPWTITRSPAQGYAYSREPLPTPMPETGEPVREGAPQ